MAELALTYDTRPRFFGGGQAFYHQVVDLFERPEASARATTSAAKPIWQSEAEKRISHLLALPGNWDGYGSEPVSQSVARFVLDALSSAAPFDAPPASIVPVSGGGLQIEWHEGGVDIELYTPRPYQAELYVAFLDGRPPIELELDTNFQALTCALQEIVGAD